MISIKNDKETTRIIKQRMEQMGEILNSQRGTFSRSSSPRKQIYF